MVESGKTFYIETFGCQMNAHDSEKVIGTLEHEGYPPRRHGRGCGADSVQHLLDPGQGGAEGVPPAERVQEDAGRGQAVRRAGVRGAAGRPEDFREGAVRVAGERIGFVPKFAGNAGAAGGRGEADYGVGRPADGRDVRHGVYGAVEPAPRVHHDHRRVRQVLLVLRGAVHARQGAVTQQRELCWRRLRGWRLRGTRMCSCWGRT